jgi:tetratricopeptide (TPR) repeat protein
MRSPALRSVHRSALLASILATCLLAPGSTVSAQGITLPPSGDNQKASVSQWIGPVELNITYHSPKVTSPTGEDRHGKIWGQLVPYGYSKQAFGTCGEKCPWRGGANENTVFRTSHDIKVEGRLLAAGSYGMHFIPGKDEWTIAFSKNSTSWGSFFYDQDEDALRITVKAVPHPYLHWLTYEFVERGTDHATVQLAWEDLAVPFKIAVDDINGVYLAALRRELRDSPGFEGSNWAAAAQFCLQNKINLEEATGWAQQAVSSPFFGHQSFTNLVLLGDLQEATGKAAEAAKSHDAALSDPSATPIDLHGYARRLQGMGKKDEAVKIFLLNAKRFPDRWPVHVGLMRAYSAQGKFADAAKEARLALAQAPDDANKKALEGFIPKLEQGKDIN